MDYFVLFWVSSDSILGPEWVSTPLQGGRGVRYILMLVDYISDK
jgi:hypothetical protein